MIFLYVYIKDDLHHSMNDGDEVRLSRVEPPLRIGLAPGSAADIRFGTSMFEVRGLGYSVPPSGYP